jgi:hypothetical protein
VNACSGFTGNLLDLQLNGGARFAVTSSGLFSSAASSGNNTIAANLLVTGDVRSNTKFYFTSSSQIETTTNGSLLFQNSAGTGFNSIQLGGTTSSFGAISQTNQTNPIISIVDASGGSTAQLAIPFIQSTTGQRYVCVTTTGLLVSSAAACVGT